MAMTNKKVYLTTDPVDKIHFQLQPQREQNVLLKLTNKSDSKMAYKVKCTRNDLFRIRPATGFVDCQESVAVTLTFAGGTPQLRAERHHFGVYYIPAPQGCTPDGVWAVHYGPALGEQKLRVVLVN